MKAVGRQRQDANASAGIGTHDVDRGMFPTRTRAGALAGLLFAGLSPLRAQSVEARDTVRTSGITVVASFSADRYVSVRAPIELTFDRFPERNEGTIAVMIGTADV